MELVEGQREPLTTVFICGDHWEMYVILWRTRALFLVASLDYPVAWIFEKIVGCRRVITSS